MREVAKRRRSCKLSIALPVSLFSDVPHLREKTFKIGAIGRSAAIFRVDEIIFFQDLPDVIQDSEAKVVATLLSYMETPQYLRKHLFAIRRELQFAGILPPLRTPHHPLATKLKNLKVGEYREGVVVKLHKSGHAYVDIGVDRLARLSQTPTNYQKLQLNARITTKIIKLRKTLEVTIANGNDVENYWGYKVTVSRLPIGELLDRRAFDLVIATSRHGIPISRIRGRLSRQLKKACTTLVAFGAPDRGLFEIVKQEGTELADISNYIINTIPFQGTATIRTEEAVHSTLTILNLMM